MRGMSLVLSSPTAVFMIYPSVTSIANQLFQLPNMPLERRHAAPLIWFVDNGIQLAQSCTKVRL
jgi:hypothetical protein